MEKNHVELVADIVDELVRWLGASFWLWMAMDALKPGIVSFYWNLPVHGGVVVVCIIISVLMDRSPVTTRASSV